MKKIVNRKMMFLMGLMIFVVMVNGLTSQEKAKDSDKEKKKKESLFHPREEIVVTATMTRKAVKDCSASVSVLGGGDLKAISASNALNLLSFSPGIYIQRTGDFGRADLHIRGLGQRGRRIAIMVDGRPEKMGLFGCTVTHAFPLDNVERIEVVRGPSSVLYGSEALGGVINILTRQAKKKVEIDFSTSYGSYNTQQYNLRHGGNLKKFNYYFTLDRRSSDGHRENANYAGNAFTGKMIYDLSEHLQASFQGKYFEGRKHEAGSIDVPLSDFWNDYERGALDFSLRGRGERDEVFVKFYRNFGHHQFSDGWHSRDYVNGGVLRYTTRRIVNNELTFGADFRILGGKCYSWPKGSWNKNEAAVFFQDEYVFWNKWILSAGIRLHRDSLYGFEICPHWGIVFHMTDKALLRSSVNKGFRSPQLNEIYMYPAANPELEPERIWSYEVGFEQKLSHWMSLSGAIYQMKGSNLIETRNNPFPPPASKFMNTGKFSFKGAELGLRSDFSEMISVLVFYTYLDQGKHTKGRPGHKLDFSLRVKKGFFYGSLQAQHVADYFAADDSQKPLPSYLLFNSRLNVKVTSFFELFLDVNNILNEDYMVYVDLPGIDSGAYPMPGRNLHLGLRLSH